MEFTNKGGIVSDNGTMWWPTKDAMDGENTSDKDNGKAIKKLKQDQFYYI